MSEYSMSAKQLIPNQCMPLHFLYGPSDCCLCNGRQEFEDYKTQTQKDMRNLLQLVNNLTSLMQQEIPIVKQSKVFSATLKTRYEL